MARFRHGVIKVLIAMAVALVVGAILPPATANALETCYGSSGCRAAFTSISSGTSTFRGISESFRINCMSPGSSHNFGLGFDDGGIVMIGADAVITSQFGDYKPEYYYFSRFGNGTSYYGHFADAGGPSYNGYYDAILDQYPLNGTYYAYLGSAEFLTFNGHPTGSHHIWGEAGFGPGAAWYYGSSHDLEYETNSSTWHAGWNWSGAGVYQVQEPTSFGAISPVTANTYYRYGTYRLGDCTTP